MIKMANKLNLFFSRTNRQHLLQPAAATFAVNTPALLRAFVETGDERCPLAGIWSRLPLSDQPLSDQPADEPHLAQPAIRWTLLPWRAFHSAPINRRYSIV
jgi:hypothetical protein